jgi:Carboxypeptidase regulatory-like domain/TonB dependent receptor/TonB-dependent Receptor Plug Domain
MPKVPVRAHFNRPDRTFVPLQRRRRQPALGAFFVALIIQILAFSIVAHAQGVTGNIKGSVSATTTDPSARPARLTGAQIAVVNADLKGAPTKTQTDGTGNFAFLDLPAGNYTLTVEADSLPGVAREIHLTTGATLVVEVVLTASVSESVTVRDEEGLLSTAETTTSNTVRAQKLEELPLRAENYQSALPLTPGVVRGLDGADHIKGTRAGQNAYTVNGADITDPVNGNLAFDIPIEAAASVQIEENPYSAEFGRFTGGATNLETKTGADKFKIGMSRFFPTLHKIIGGKIDSFRPRLTFSGPLIRKRLNFLQSFEYRFSRIFVPSLTAPRDNSTAEAFSSFTQLDLIVNNSNRLKFVGALFPQKQRYVGLNTFNPQETTPNTKQRGELFSISEQAIFHDASFLSSLVSYKIFQFEVFGQGLKPLTVLPDGNTGNYFANSRRAARRMQWQEHYFARPFTLGGQHSLKLGAEFDYTWMSGVFSFRPVEIRRRDGTISERIAFTGPTSIHRPLGEFGAFVQDRWVINRSLTIDTGLRFDRDSISRHNNVAPRLSILYLPFNNERTIVRAGVGLFYDRSPLSSRYFELNNVDDNDDLLGVASPTHYPGRIVTTFAPDGTIVDGPRHFMNVVKGPLRDAHSTRWSLQLDRGFTQHLTARIGYLQRSTVNEPIVYPHVKQSGGGTLVLKSRGRSQYREIQMLAVYNSERFHNWNISYVWSSARGHLNSADNFLGDFPALVVRSNQYGPLPFDVPHRFLAYGEIKAPYEVSVSPALEIHTGFPYSLVDDRLDFVGLRNRAGRFPTFISLDVSILKSFRVPFFDKRARAGVVIFNITNHFNPRDVQNNTASLHAGEFFNSLGTSVRGKFEMDF